MHERALLLGVGLGREDDVGVLAQPSVRNAAWATTVRGGGQRALPQLGGRAGRAAGRLQQVERRSSPRRGPRRSPARRGPPRPSGGLGEARAGVGQHAGLAQAAPVGARRDFEQAGAVGAGEPEAAGDLEQRGAPAAPSGPAVRRSPQRITISRGASRASSLCRRRAAARERASVLGVGAGRRARAARAPRRAAGSAAASAAAKAAPRAGREAHARRGARRRASSAARQATASCSAVAAHALAQAQVEDRRVVDGLGVEHQHGVGELEVARRAPAARARRARAAAPSGSAPARRESRCGEPSALAHQAREQQALLVGRSARRRARRAARAGARSPAAASLSARSQETGRSSPPSRSSGSVMRSSTWKDW